MDKLSYSNKCLQEKTKHTKEISCQNVMWVFYSGKNRLMKDKVYGCIVTFNLWTLNVKNTSVLQALFQRRNSQSSGETHSCNTTAGRPPRLHTHQWLLQNSPAGRDVENHFTRIKRSYMRDKWCHLASGHWVTIQAIRNGLPLQLISFSYTCKQEKKKLSPQVVAANVRIHATWWGQCMSASPCWHLRDVAGKHLQCFHWSDRTDACTPRRSYCRSPPWARPPTTSPPEGHTDKSPDG